MSTGSKENYVLAVDENNSITQEVVTEAEIANLKRCDQPMNTVGGVCDITHPLQTWLTIYPADLQKISDHFGSVLADHRYLRRCLGEYP